MRIIGFFLILGFIFSACNNTPEPVKVRDADLIKQMKELSEEMKEEAEKYPRQNAISPKEKAINHEKIVARYGEQWDFCSCVQVHDSINRVLQNDLTDKEGERLMERWAFIENKCKEFLTNPNTTPEEREAHGRKVNKCLEK